MPLRTEALLALTREAIDLLSEQRRQAAAVENALAALLAELEAREEDEEARRG